MFAEGSRQRPKKCNAKPKKSVSCKGPAAMREGRQKGDKGEKRRGSKKGKKDSDRRGYRPSVRENDPTSNPRTVISSRISD